jgi:amidase
MRHHVPVTDELWRLDALHIARLVRTREVTSREVVTSHLERIDQVNGSVRAVVRLLADEALEAADRADAAVASGAPLGPLHGVPFTVKENIDVAGTPTTNGITVLADAVADVDAPTVERLRAAGAIPIARTNLPDLGLRITTDSSLHGITSNPWDPSLTAGGSSGGEAAALVTGMSPLGLGNDLGGSLRNPAHCCGISSLKPTPGVVPHATVVPPLDPAGTFQVMNVQGVMARTVADVRAGLLAVTGQHRRDPLSLPLALPTPPERPLRIALLPEPPGGSTARAVGDVVRRAGSHLADAGHTVVESCPPQYERAVELWGRLLAGDLRTMRPLLDAVMGERARRFLDFTDEQLPHIDLATWSLELTERHAIAREWTAWFGDVDVLVCPVWTEPAFAEGSDIADAAGAAATLELMRPVLPANLLGLPAAVTRGATVDGLPIGVQFVGAPFADLVCLAAAADLEARVGPITPIDPVTLAH